MTEARSRAPRAKRPAKPVEATKAKTTGKAAEAMSAQDWPTLQEQVRRGAKFAIWQHLKSKTGTADKELLKIVGISPRTLERRREARHFEPDETERILRITRILDLAVEVFEGDEAAALDWLGHRSVALGGQTPWSALDTEPGARMVEDALYRLEYGVYG